MNAFPALRPGRVAAAVGAVAASLVVAACGGGVATVGAAGAEGASLVPASAPVFLAVDTDFGSESWRQLNALLARFPSGGKLLDSLTASLSRQGLDFEHDVKPALGPETDVALLDLPAQGDPTAVLLTKPPDPGKLEALLGKAANPPAWKVVDGWYVIGQTKDAVDRAVSGAADNPLAGASTFEDALGSLSGSPMARLYLNGPALTTALQRSMAQSGGTLPFDLGSLGGGGTLESAAVGVSPEQGGLRIEGVLRTQGAPAPKLHKAELLSLVPGDALAVVSFSGLQDGLKQLLDTIGTQQSGFDQALSRAELALGVSIENDVLPIFAGEGALYVRAAAPIPEVTLVLSPQDPTKALATLDKLTAGIGAFGGGSTAFTESTETIAVQTVKKLAFGRVSLYYGVVEDHLVITTAVKGIADLVAGSGSLADDPQFQKAKEAAGLPDDSSGFVYVDLSGALGALESAGVLRNADAETLSNLRPLAYVLGYATAGEKQTRFAGFIRIQ